MHRVFNVYGLSAPTMGEVSALRDDLFTNIKKMDTQETSEYGSVYGKL